MMCSAENLTQHFDPGRMFAHCMGIGPKQQQLDVLDCEQDIRSCLVCKRHLAPSPHVDRQRQPETLHLVLDLRQDRPHMDWWCARM
jgi:hypothetical protein